jgi:site-specific recombinase XerD
MPRDVGENHHLMLHRGLWHIRVVLPKSLGSERLVLPTGMADVRTARRIRDQVLRPILEEKVTSEIARLLLKVAAQADSSAESIVRNAAETFGLAKPSGISLRQAITRFIDNRLNFKKRSGGTVSDYEEVLNGLAAVLGSIELQQVTSKALRDFRDKLMLARRFWNRKGAYDLSPVAPEKRLSTSTVIKTFRNLHTFFEWAMKEELIERNPVVSVDLPTHRKEHTPPVPPELADRLCRLPAPRSRLVGELEWEVLPWFFRYTGARLGEIARLIDTDVVIEHGVRCLSVYTEKTAMRAEAASVNEKRLVPIHPRLAPFLDRVLERRRGGPMFRLAGHKIDARITETRYGYEWGRLYSRHAQRVWAPMHTHCWRSYVVTEMARAGIAEEVRMRLVGHITKTVHQGYTGVDVSRLVEAVNAIP